MTKYFVAAIFLLLFSSFNVSAENPALAPASVSARVIVEKKSNFHHSATIPLEDINCGPVELDQQAPMVLLINESAVVAVLKPMPVAQLVETHGLLKEQLIHIYPFHFFW